MHEYMKKAKLIAALLVVSSAFVPCLSSVADFPDRTSEMAHVAARPLFWQFWDELLSRELAQWTKTFQMMASSRIGLQNFATPSLAFCSGFFSNAL
jgi:hypothetical protein